MVQNNNCYERIILLDSSLLMYVIKSRRNARINLQEALLDLSEGAKLAVLDTTIEELRKLSQFRKGKTKLAADFALEFIKKNRIKIITVSEDLKNMIKEKLKKESGKDYYDNILLEFAVLKKASVATADMALVKKLRKRGITCYFPQGYKWLKVSGFQP